MDAELKPKPNQPIIKREDSNLAIALAKEGFRSVLQNPSGQYHFQKFLQTEKSEENLSFWLAVEEYQGKTEKSEKEEKKSKKKRKQKKQGDSKVARAIFRLYIVDNAERQINIYSETQREIALKLKKHPADLFEAAQTHIFDLMFSDSYRRFVFIALQMKAQQELQIAKMNGIGDVPDVNAIDLQVGNGNGNELSREGESFLGLGDCFCLTDPALPDNPIVAVSDGFVHVTGHPKQNILNHNCRFLQGPGTDQEVIKRMSENLKAERETAELLLNFKKDGTPFWNLLYITPLKDQSGKTVFFLGGQVDVTKNVNNTTPIKDVLAGAEALQQQIDKNKSNSKATLNTKPAAKGLQRSSSSGEKMKKGNFFTALFRRTSSLDKLKSKELQPSLSSATTTTTTAEQVTVNPNLDLIQQKAIFLQTYSNFVVFSNYSENSTGSKQRGVVQFVSNLFTEITGFESHQVIGRDLSFLKGRLTSPNVVKELKAAIKQEVPWSREIIAYDAKSQPHVSNLYLTPLNSSDSSAKMFVMVMKWRPLTEAEYEEAKWRANSEQKQQPDPEDCVIS